MIKILEKIKNLFSGKTVYKLKMKKESQPQSNQPQDSKTEEKPQEEKQ